MQFGWINVFNAIIIVIMLIPNILFANKVRQAEGIERNIVIRISEYIGRIGCIVFMILPVGIGAFGFRRGVHFELYMIINSCLLLVYLVVWDAFRKEPTFRRALVLAIAPSLMFLATGLLLNHWLLVISAGVFLLAHFMNTYFNYRNLD